MVQNGNKIYFYCINNRIHSKFERLALVISTKLQKIKARTISTRQYNTKQSMAIQSMARQNKSLTLFFFTS